MFRAQDQTNGTDLTILDLEREGVERLRARALRGELRCPLCKGEVLVRAGDVRRWHFAHRELADCPLESEPAERTALRAHLYSWLRRKFPDRVRLEERFPGLDLPWPVDVVAEPEGGPVLAWWILTGGIRSVEERAAMSHGLLRRGVRPTFLFSRRILRRRGERRIDLRPTEREFMRFCAEGLSTRLHYLDGATGLLTTVRGLRRTENPHRFRCNRVLEGPLEEVLVAPRTGELVHPAEADDYVERTRREKERRRELEILAARRKLAPPPPEPEPEPEPEADPDPDPCLCERCGRDTPEIDRTVEYGGTGRCICRSCLSGAAPD